MQVHWRQSLMSYTFLAPALILLAVFTFYPLLYGAYLGFTEYNGARFANHLPPQWVGLRNFETVLGDPLFRTALANSVKYLLVVPALQLASLAVAVLVAKNIPGIALFRAAYYVPVITSVSLAAVMWEWVFNREGTLNWLLRALHLTTPEAAFGWLNNEQWAFWAVMLVTFWRGFGYYMVLYLAGLQAIPEELEEAAILDGASAWQRFWRVTVPLMRPTILLCTLLSTIAALRVLEEVLVLTNGGPLNSTYTALMYVYAKAFQGFDFDYGVASAAGLVVALVALLLSALNFRFFHREGEQA
ncbi:carbohydrate ABC transporter permease [Deinococcus soli (ex Cha et al. 2016)]|uniref:Chitobiose transport system permease protein n=2 Tax=Deinococcus soli (ex Cha et al. 2016) TaxID=1309411 RepID=A0AAE3XBZ0_9DEIO|nr:sugar ABC transporter permease [Deinococcus soli (ex Cha et al. 2016)]MDR6217869.1 putative chitobiose transport system permease protein [Deinococcus soli (ex Cha et al. 2016)]MDR6328119.1 putative chitobiose transport system permease protein [Deinococcus soli (ex Cha et al. 2016)]MDR6750971.1 putative chitobiose transport system permease protein [Deinococcus soli (ex Cha et al. 2016)]GGB56260.1 lactose ABC transporter permease [Deinococcus soli (ex Cha et al. 2016)]